jgi:HisJ family histidinol phosphate phosphatase
MLEYSPGFPKLDLHTHSRFSDGNQTFEEIFNEAQRKELLSVAVTDHHPNTGLLDTYEHANDLEDIRRMKEQCRAISEGAQTRFLLGVEADIIDLDGCLNIRQEIASEVDFVIASLHIIPGIEMKWDKVASGKVGVDRKKVANRCIEAEIAGVKNGHVDVLGHPMYVISVGRYLRSIDEVDNALLVELAETAAKHNVAIEVNGHFFREFTPPSGYFHIFEMCLERGVKLSTGTDAHRRGHVGDLKKIHATLSRLKAKPSDIYSPIAEG